MKITSIERQINNNKRYSVFIDNNFAFGIDEIDLLYYKLKENEDISKEKYNNILNNTILIKAKSKAEKYLSYKSRTEKEIKDKLSSEEYPKDIIDKVIELMKKYNYIDDEIYCLNFAKEKFRLKGYGKKRILYELVQKGIPSKTAESVINEINFDEDKKAAELLYKKTKGNYNFDFKQKQKLSNYLIRRGFSFDTIKNAFEILTNDEIEL